MRKELKNLLSFLTVLPFKMDMDFLVDSAKLMWIFPLVGALLGALAGIFGWAVGLILPSEVVGVLALAVLLMLTGLHHTDGLLDFGDAVMYNGTAERKIEIMHDQLTGAGAIGLGLMTYLITALALGEFGGGIFIGGVAVPVIIPVLIVVELCAKLSMVVATWAGRPVYKGMNSPFMDTMHSKRGGLHLSVALALSLSVAMPLLWLTGFVTVLVAVLSGLVMVVFAHRHFGGVTGDVLGATNEIVRMVCVVVLLAMLK